MSIIFVGQSCPKWGGNPGLVVEGGDSNIRGCEFESQCHILDGSFFAFICCVKIEMMFVKTENKRKRPREWPIIKSYPKCYLR